MWFLVTFLAACAAPEPHHPAVDRLLRVSMALRGTRPSLDEIEQVREDPATHAAIVDGYVEGDAFGATIRDLHARDLLLRSEAHRLPALGALEGVDEPAINRSVMEEPLRLVEWVVREGHPYTEIVTTDTVLADATVSAVWGLEYDPGGPEWQETRWPDGRPAAGILASSALWFRHATNGINNNRARANRVARALVCQDFLVGDVPLDALESVDARAIADAVSADPMCVGCHADLDPIASFFFGFAEAPGYSAVVADCAADGVCYPISSWDAAASDTWADARMPAPAWSGTPGGDLADLGRLVAADARFGPCAARRFLAWFRQVEPAEVEEEDVDPLADVFATFDARSLARAAVDAPSFLASGPLLVRPEQLSRLLRDLTGFTWQDAMGTDLLVSDASGYRTLAGGMDYFRVARVDPVPSATVPMVWARVAEEAAVSVVAADLAEPTRGARRLLTKIDAADAGEDAVREQVAALHLRILGEEVEPDGDIAGDTFDLFQQARDRSHAPHAWEVVVAALLQDPRIMWY